MTIRFIKSWNGYYEGQIVTNPNGGNSEATLIALGYAVADLDGPDNGTLPVMASANLTGGSSFSGGPSTLKLPAGVTDLSGPVYRQSGSSAAPVSTLDGVAGLGVFGTAKQLKIPANSIVAGSSRLRIKVWVGKVGTDVGYFDVRFGASGGTSDGNLMAGNSLQFTAATPGECYFDIEVQFTAACAATSFNKQLKNVSSGFTFASELTGLNFAVDNYISFVMSGTAAGTTYSLLGYDFQFFP